MSKGDNQLPLGQRATPLGAGSTIGAFRLLEVIAQGAMGVVYRAEHIKLGRKVALKMLRPEYAGNPLTVQRFFQEARAVNQVSHENVLEITDFLEGVDGAQAFVCELLQGVVLGSLVKQRVLPLERSLPIAIQVASALNAVHAAGIVHRDLKPDNIFLVRRGNRDDFVKLLDFGVAKMMHKDPAAGMDATVEGAIVGTPEYMSPEQASGEPVDQRSDVYTFGAVLYQLVTGKKVFQAKNFGELVIKHVTVPPTPPSRLEGLPHAIPPELDTLIMACLEKSPAARPQSMVPIEAELRIVLQMLVGGELDGLTPTGVERALSASAASRAKTSPVDTAPAATLDPLPPDPESTEARKPARRSPALFAGALTVSLVLGGMWIARHRTHARHVVAPTGATASSAAPPTPRAEPPQAPAAKEPSPAPVAAPSVGEQLTTTKEPGRARSRRRRDAKRSQGRGFDAGAVMDPFADN